MRRLAGILMLCLLGISAWAAPVSPSRAREIAGQFLRIPSDKLRMSFDAPSLMPLSVDEPPAWYVFDGRPDGFVIVSGDDCVTPVLGYSATGHIDCRNMPPALSAWLEQVGEAVRVARKYGMPSYEGPVPAAAGTGGKLLILPEWDQDYPFNWYCPTITPYEEEKAVAGCVGLSMAMVLRYYEWPPCGHGTVPDYEMLYWPAGAADSDYKTTLMPGTELGHEYRWQQMPMSVGRTGSEMATQPEPSAAIKEIAWAIYDCGLMLKSNYSFDGTGAYSGDIPGCFTRYLYYTNDVKYVRKATYSGDWLKMLKGQIDAGRPVIYGARSNSEGHQFLVTGYDNEDNLYVNWGWGGLGNGYFSLDYLYPYKNYDLTRYGYTEEEIREIETALTFSYAHDAVIDIIPDKSFKPTPSAAKEPEPVVIVIGSSEEHAPNLYLEAGTDLGHEFTGLSVNGNLQRGSSFTMDAGLIHNSGGEMYVGWFRLMHLDWQNEQLETIGTVPNFLTIMPGRYSYVRGIPCTASIEFCLGDKIALCTSESEVGPFATVKCADDLETVGEIPLIPMYFISQDGGNHLINSIEKYSSVEWSTQSGMTKAVIKYPDGSVETIVQGY